MKIISHKAVRCILFTILSLGTTAQAREHIQWDDGWEFAFGNAVDPTKDFGCGTEYFNYLTKAASIHNQGPYSLKFNKDEWPNEWKEMALPHDWVVDLPFDSTASHSHGYKAVGFQFPENSVGWYRKAFEIPAEDKGKHIALQFDGIFRDSRLWVNGFYLGNEPSGYVSRTYDISEYLNYGGENVVAVRVDASLQEGWFYEGAGIYRHVWLNKAMPVHVAPNGTFVTSQFSASYGCATLDIRCRVDNKGVVPVGYSIRHEVVSPDGMIVGNAETSESNLLAKDSRESSSTVSVENPVLWDLDDPALYDVVTTIIVDGEEVDRYTTRIGLRDLRFDADNGFYLNGRPVKLKGVNMHQDHAGVGSALPDALQVFRLRELKKMGVNAYRSSHNPMTPEMLDACDSLGVLVIEENRLMGINDEHLRQLRLMIERDRNHPSIILWSVGNEEWGIEWNEQGRLLAESMREYTHRLDSSRPMCVASSGGRTVLVPADVAGYNYIMQNPVDQHRADYPKRCAIGTEETSGCGTRGVYYPRHDLGRMVALNRCKDRHDSTYNAIERGWKFYDERPWLGGLFYWTGFDYRGEPNPMKFPATGSQFGILDYCGFPKDEAYYLMSWWTDEPVLHIFPHWNLAGHEGEPVSVWAYSNADEVELFLNGKSIGRKQMPHNGHLEWPTVYTPGRLKAVGYKNGKKAITQTVETTGAPCSIALSVDRQVINADNRDVAVVRVAIQDGKGRFVPDACVPLSVTVDGPARILGVGNGDPAYGDAERPRNDAPRTCQVRSFNGLAQILLQSTGTAGSATITVNGEGVAPSSHTVDCN